MCKNSSDSAPENAEHPVLAREIWLLEQADAELFAMALEKPPTLGAKLQQVADRYNGRFLKKQVRSV